MSKFGPQLNDEITGQSGYTHRFDLYHSDLTQTTANTAQTFTAFLPVRAGDKIEKVCVMLAEPFQNTADTAFNDTQIEVGDSGDLDNFIVAIQANYNGTLGVFPAENTGDALPYTIPATPLAIDVTVLSMSGKSLSNLNKGHLVVLFAIFRETQADLLAPTGNEKG